MVMLCCALIGFRYDFFKLKGLFLRPSLSTMCVERLLKLVARSWERVSKLMDRALLMRQAL